MGPKFADQEPPAALAKPARPLGESVESSRRKMTRCIRERKGPDGPAKKHYPDCPEFSTQRQHLPGIKAGLWSRGHLSLHLRTLPGGRGQTSFTEKWLTGAWLTAAADGKAERF